MYYCTCVRNAEAISAIGKRFSTDWLAVGGDTDLADTHTCVCSLCSIDVSATPRVCKQ